MRLSTDQLERLAERVFKVLSASGHAAFDLQLDERIGEKTVSTIMEVLEDDTRTEDRLSREAERLVQQQQQIAKTSGKSLDDLTNEVKTRLARSKRLTLGDGPERADDLAEKIYKSLWRMEGIDFYSEETKVRNCIARAIHRFRVDDDRVVEAVERILSRKLSEPPYSAAWCLAYDRTFQEVRAKQVAAGGSTGREGESTTGTSPKSGHTAAATASEESPPL